MVGRQRRRHHKMDEGRGVGCPAEVGGTGTRSRALMVVLARGKVEVVGKGAIDDGEQPAHDPLSSGA